MKRLILLLFLFANIGQMSAQTMEIKGTVFNDGQSIH